MKMEIITDKTGYPMIFIEPGDFYIHWLPVTKIQLEYFLSSTTLTEYNETWYSDIRHYNERVSPGALTVDNYWQALVTGVLPREARHFAQWSGSQFRIPTEQQWLTTYQFLKKESADPNHIEQLVNGGTLSKRTQTLVTNIERCVSAVETSSKGRRSLVDQMLMRMGVMEYVLVGDGRSNEFGGLGQTNSNFFGSFENPDKGHHERLSDKQEGARMRHYGFRLIRQKG